MLFIINTEALYEAGNKKLTSLKWTHPSTKIKQNHKYESQKSCDGLKEVVHLLSRSSGLCCCVAAGSVSPLSPVDRLRLRTNQILKLTLAKERNVSIKGRVEVKEEEEEVELTASQEERFTFYSLEKI